MKEFFLQHPLEKVQQVKKKKLRKIITVIVILVIIIVCIGVGSSSAFVFKRVLTWYDRNSFESS